MKTTKKLKHRNKSAKKRKRIYKKREQINQKNEIEDYLERYGKIEAEYYGKQAL